MSERCLLSAGSYRVGELFFALTANCPPEKSESTIGWLSRVFSLFKIESKVPVLKSPELIKSWPVPDGQLLLLRTENDHEFRFSPETMDSLSGGLASVEVAIINYAISCFDRKLWLHAAGLLRGDNLIVFVGASGYGKSTLSLAFLNHDWRLFSDDILIISMQEPMKLLPFPRCPKVRPSAEKQLGALGVDFKNDVLTGGYVALDQECFIRSEEILQNKNITFFFLSHRDQRLAGAESLSVTDALIELAKCSNLLHLDPGLERAEALFKSARFFRLPAVHLRLQKEIVQSLI